MGLQHQRTGGGEKYWRLLKPSHLYFLQNDAAAAVWPVGQPLVSQLLAAFKAPS